MIKVYFDTTEVSNPTNWQEAKSTLKRDEELFIYLLYAEGDYEFGTTGYTYLRNKLDDAFCNQVSVSIQAKCNGDSYAEIMSGIINISDVEFNERTCIAKTKIQDKSFFAFVNNNKKIKTCINSALSKNAEAITAPEQCNIDVYSITTNTLINDAPCYRVYEAFRYMIDFMTDGAVSFASDTFGMGGTWDGLVITSGKNLRTYAYSDMPQFSFEQLYKEVNARIPLILIVDNPLSNPTIRIESRDYIKTATQVFQADSIYEIITKTDTQKLYSVVRVGGPIDETIGLSFPEQLRFFGFNEEEYHTAGQCNIDSTLDLTYSWNSSSNLIENVGTTDYDGDIFMLHCTLTSATAGRTTNDNFLQLTPALYYYNYELTNNRILSRYQGFLPNNLINYQGTVGDGLFKAFSAGVNVPALAGTSNDNVDFTNVATNPGSYYDGTDTYTATYAGLYTMRLYPIINVSSITGTPTRARFAFYFQIYDASNNLLDSVYCGATQFITTTGTYNIIADNNGLLSSIAIRRLILRAGDYVTVKCLRLADFVTISATITNNSFWDCTANTVGGGVFQESDPNDYGVRTHEFVYPLSQSDFNAILANPRGYVRFAQEGQTYRKGWIQEIKYDHIAGLAAFKLITDKNSQDAAN